MIDNCEHSKYQVTDLQFYFGSTAMPHGPSNGLVIIWLVKKTSSTSSKGFKWGVL